jgi:O-antigen ligase
LFAQRPLTGWGFGQFEHVIQTEAGSGLFGYFSTGAARGLASHNIFLRLAAETGLVGLLLFLALLGRWLRRAFTSTLEDNHETSAAGILFLAALIAYLSEALFHDPTHSIPPHLTLFFLAGTLPRHTPEK